MSPLTQAMIACAAVTAALRATGPVLLGGRQLPDPVAAVIGLVAPSLFAALVVTQALADGGRLSVGADTLGVVVGGLAAWRGMPIPLCLLLAAGVTAGLRLPL